MLISVSVENNERIPKANQTHVPYLTPKKKSNIPPPFLFSFISPRFAFQKKKEGLVDCSALCRSPAPSIPPGRPEESSTTILFKCSVMWTRMMRDGRRYDTVCVRRGLLSGAIRIRSLTVEKRPRTFFLLLICENPQGISVPAFAFCVSSHRYNVGLAGYVRCSCPESTHIAALILYISKYPN